MSEKPIYSRLDAEVKNETQGSNYYLCGYCFSITHKFIELG